MMTSISIAREKELGTMEILLVSPVKPAQIIVGKVLPYVLLSFINAAVILLISYFVFGMPFVGSVSLLLAESLLFIVVALSLGIFLFNGFQQSAGCDDAFDVCPDVAHDFVVGIYFSGEKYARGSAMVELCHATEIFHYHRKRNHAERKRNCRFMERDFGFDWNGTLFYSLECEEV